MSCSGHQKMSSFPPLFLLCFFHLCVFSSSAVAECNFLQENEINDQSNPLKYKLIAISSILASSALGASFPIFGKKIKIFNPEHNIFFLIKGLAAGVILATGFVHILPDAFHNLTSPCLDDQHHTWAEFPFAGFIAMVSAIITMMIDALATSYYKKSHFNKSLPLDENEDEHDDVEMKREEHHEGHVHVHTHASHGHAHGSAISDAPSAHAELLRHRVISQVLEMGILFHSVIIGISLGASESTKTIKPLAAALTFHQFFEGLGLGGCISQAKLKYRAVAIMFIFYCFTTPIGIGIGIGISKFYHENSPAALIVGGVFNSASAGILIYMALVDLLAQDLANPKLQANFKLQLGAYFSLLFGLACMSLLAKWT